jgi:signal transduction histidine kinase
MEKSILLVDDEEGIRKVLGIALSDMGYHVRAAENGVEALRIITDERPPIVLTDIKMPEMDGIELLRRLKKVSPDTEVIMVTGHGDMDLAIQSVKYEATDFVTKPINHEVLEIALIEAERLTAVGQTVAGLSHAIKNITGGLKGGAFVLEKGIELSDQKYLLQGWEMIKGNVDKITNLSMDLLNYAKATDLNIQPCDPGQPAQEVVDLMGPRAQELGIELVSDFSQNLGLCQLDSDLICRCLLNLVTNAIDACRNDDLDAPDKIVTVRTKKTRGWGVEYQVLDNGCGMNAAAQKNIFKRFFSTKGSEGTGIGLMITKKIIDEHKGVIKVESKEGAGSKFFIKLPKKPDG